MENFDAIRLELATKVAELERENTLLKCRIVEYSIREGKLYRQLSELDNRLNYLIKICIK